jgi:hypothetical protein
MPEGGKSGHDTFYVNPEFAGKMGMEPPKKKFDLPPLDDEELGYDPAEPTTKDKIQGQAAGEIVSENKGSDQTVMSSRVELGGEQTRISKRSTDKTEFVDLGSLGEDDDGKNGETAIVHLPKRKN